MKDDLSDPPEIKAILEAAKRIEKRRNKSFKVDQAKMEEFRGLLDRESSFGLMREFIGPTQINLQS